MVSMWEFVSDLLFAPYRLARHQPSTTFITFGVFVAVLMMGAEFLGWKINPLVAVICGLLAYFSMSASLLVGAYYGRSQEDQEPPE